MSERSKSAEFERLDPETFSLVRLEPYLPPDWDKQILHVASEFQKVVMVEPSSTSRRDDTRPFRLRTVTGNVVSRQLPWLTDLYYGEFSQIASRGLGSRIIGTTINDEYAVVLNILGPNDDLYETHIDNNGATLVLPATNHSKPGDGGELVMSLDPNARDFFPTDDPSSLVVPTQKGRGIIFDGTDKPHYVRLPSIGDRITA